MAAPTLALLRTQSDERLAALARDGHERAFEAIVDRYRRELLRHGHRVVGEARAEDVVQHALVAAWAALRRGDDVRDLRPWLHRIVHNLSLNVLRGGRDDYAELRESMQVGGAPEEELERRIIVRDTLAALAALPERQREALLQVAVQGRSQEEVAETFGLSHGAVRQLVHRARTALRAAATAVVPLPVASWLASVGTRTEPVGARIAEMVSDSGSAGLASMLAKAGAVAALAGSVAAGPAIVENSGGRGDTARAADLRTDSRPAPSAPRPSPPAAVAPVVSNAASSDEGDDADSPRSGSLRRSSGMHRDDSRHRGSGSRSSGGSSGPGPGDDDQDVEDRSGPGPGSGGGGGSSGPESGDDGGHSGSGSSGSETESHSGSGHSGSETESHSGSGKDGSPEAPAPAETPVPSPTPSSDNSGSGSSGSGSSGSGSGGSGSGGSGSSGPG